MSDESSATQLSEPRGAYKPLTLEAINAIRREFAEQDQSGGWHRNMETLCNMAENCLLYAEEIQRLRGERTPLSAEGESTPTAAQRDAVSEWLKTLQEMQSKGREINWVALAHQIAAAVAERAPRSSTASIERIEDNICAGHADAWFCGRNHLPAGFDHCIVCCFEEAWKRSAIGEQDK